MTSTVIMIIITLVLGVVYGVRLHRDLQDRAAEGFRDLNRLRAPFRTNRRLLRYSLATQTPLNPVKTSSAKMPQ